MSTVGCAICREPIIVAHQDASKLNWCKKHPNRALIDKKVLDQSPKDLLLGEIVNQTYVLTKPLGKGGFGSVYYAALLSDPRRAVAIKFLTRHSPAFIELFKDEMKVMQRLRSPYIVQLLHSGEHESDSSKHRLPFILMEYVKGETLTDRLIKKGPLSPKQVLEMLRQLLTALVDAHETGIIHRDLKPLNLMLNEEEQDQLHLVVLDFGVARSIDEATREATRNKIMGTPYYLAPEVLLKGELTHQTDLFACAVIAYESLSYRSPFLNEALSGLEPYVRLREIYKSQQKPNPLPKHLPKEWTQFFECALDSHAQNRFPDAKSMLIAVEALAYITMGEYKDSNKDQKKMVFDPFDEDEETRLFINQLAADSDLKDSLLSDDHDSVLDMDSSQASEELDKTKNLSEVKPPPLPLSDFNVKAQSKPQNIQISPPPILNSTIKLNHQHKPKLNAEPMNQARSHPQEPLVVPPSKEVVTQQLKPHSTAYMSAESIELQTATILNPNQVSRSTKQEINPQDVLTIQIGQESPLLKDHQTRSNLQQIKPMLKPQQNENETVGYPIYQNGQTHSPKQMTSQSNLTPIPIHREQEISHSRPNSTFIWFQLLIMVGFGMLFAYVIADHILK